MRKSLLASAVVAGLGIASASQAAVVVSYIDRGVPSSATNTATGFHGWTVRLTETTGANITAVDMESGNNGFFAKMMQRWSASDDDANYNTKTVNVNGNNQNLTQSVVNFDSHLLFLGNPPADSNYVGKINFDESMGGAPFPPPPGGVPGLPANTTGTGIGVSSDTGYIQAAFGINGPAQTSQIDLAYVVLPEGYTFNPTLTNLPGGEVQPGFGTVLVAVAGGSPQLVTFPAIPEPGTLGLAGLSALGFLARRRKA